MRTSRRRVWFRPRWVPSPLALAAIGAILIATTLVVRWQDQRVPDGWVNTTATVTQVLPPPDPCFRNCHDTFVIAFQGAGTHLYDGPAEAGEILPVAYDPHGSRWKVSNHGRYVPWTMGLPGVVLLVVAVLIAVFTVPRPRFPLGHPQG
jgi:hypothetical protein